MRKRLQIALMASPVIATFLSLTTPYLRAQAGSASITSSFDSSGRKVYVNDETPVGAKTLDDSRSPKQRTDVLEPDGAYLEAGCIGQNPGGTFGCGRSQHLAEGFQLREWQTIYAAGD